MPGPPAARLTDLHVCPKVTAGIPHVGGPVIAPCCPPVLIGMMPAARVTDMLICVGPPDQIVMGAFTTLIGMLPAARIGDETAHGGAITTGFPTVLIGDAPAGSPAALEGAAKGAAMAGALNKKQDDDERRKEINAQRAAKGWPPLTDSDPLPPPGEIGAP